jgi:cholest-4-en-3-one 26-monooxygenase
MLHADPPQHTKLRGIVSRGFTPRTISSLRPALTARAEQIVQAALATGTGDFVSDVACELAMAEERKARPRDDLVTKLISAEVDGKALTADEFGYFVILGRPGRHARRPPGRPVARGAGR